MSFNTFVGASPPGAGRNVEAWIDTVHLLRDSGTTQAFAAAAPPRSLARIGGQAATLVGQPNTAFNTVGNFQAGLYRGRICYKFTPAGAPNISCIYGPNTQFQKPPFNITSDEPYIWRHVAVMATGPCGPQAFPVDAGFMFTRAQLTTGFSQSTGAGGITAFGLYWDANGRPTWYSRRTQVPGPSDENIPLPNNPGDQDWHAVEFRFVGATSLSDATVALLFDNVTVIQRNWGPGTLLPDYSSDPTMVGSCGQIAIGGTSFSSALYVSEFRVIGAPLFQALF